MEQHYFPFLSPRTLRGYLFIMLVVLLVVPWIWRSQNQLTEKVNACEAKIDELEKQIQLMQR